MKEMSAGFAGLPAKLMDERMEAPKPRGSMGKDDFMKLLLSQLKHQDPLKPMDHQEFASQLAQFGQLEQLTNIGSGISGLKTGMGDDAKLQAIGMIGKRVQATGSELELISGQSVTLLAALPDNVRPVKTVIIDGTGKIVRELNMTDGSKEIQWDGKDQDGISLPSGKYLFRVHGVGQNGQAQEARSELSGKVVGVEMEGKEPSLVVQTASGQTKISMAKVQRVMLDAEPAVSAGGGAGAKSGVIGAVEKPKVAVASNLAVAAGPQKPGETGEVGQTAESSADPFETDGDHFVGRDPHALFLNNQMEVMQR